MYSFGMTKLEALSSPTSSPRAASFIFASSFAPLFTVSVSGAKVAGLLSSPCLLSFERAAWRATELRACHVARFLEAQAPNLGGRWSEDPMLKFSYFRQRDVVNKKTKKVRGTSSKLEIDPQMR